MRFRKPLILAGLTALVGLGLILGGCSSDDKQPTTNRNIDPTNQMIDAVSAQVSVQLDSIISNFETGLHMSQVKSTGGIVAGNGDIRLTTLPGEESEYSDGWYVWVEGDLGASLGDFQVDSLQYLAGQDVLEDALGADGLTYKHAYVSNATDTMANYDNVSLDGDLNFSNTDGDTATIAGSFDINMMNKDVYTDSTVWQTWDFQVALTNVQVVKGENGWNTGCPCSGSAEITVEYDYSKAPFTTMETSWTYSVTFDNGSIQVDVAKENLNTSYNEEVCTQ